jgi:hypothetical protein
MSLSVSLLFIFSDLLLMDTKTAAVSTMVIDAKTIEAIAYNIAAMVQIQPSMSKPADVSLPLPSLDLLLMKDTKTVAVSTVVIDAKTIEAIAYNIAATADPALLRSVADEVHQDGGGAKSGCRGWRRP